MSATTLKAVLLAAYLIVGIVSGTLFGVLDGLTNANPLASSTDVDMKDSYKLQLEDSSDFVQSHLCGWI